MVLGTRYARCGGCRNNFSSGGDAPVESNRGVSDDRMMLARRPGGVAGREPVRERRHARSSTSVSHLLTTPCLHAQQDARAHVEVTKQGFDPDAHGAEAVPFDSTGNLAGELTFTDAQGTKHTLLHDLDLVS